MRGGTERGWTWGAGRAGRGNGPAVRRALQVARQRRGVAISRRSGLPGMARRWIGSGGSPRLGGVGWISAVRSGRAACVSGCRVRLGNRPTRPSGCVADARLRCGNIGVPGVLCRRGCRLAIESCGTACVLGGRDRVHRTCRRLGPRGRHWGPDRRAAIAGSLAGIRQGACRLAVRRSWSVRQSSLGPRGSFDGGRVALGRELSQGFEDRRERLLLRLCGRQSFCRRSRQGQSGGRTRHERESRHAGRFCRSRTKFPAARFQEVSAGGCGKIMARRAGAAKSWRGRPSLPSLSSAAGLGF